MYRPEIDGLRAVAIIAIIINHFDKSLLPNGYLGVDIFFVISGFVITQSISVKQYQTFTLFILDFFNRRIKRLLPVLLLCVFVTGVIALLFINPKNYDTTPLIKTGITALFGFSNLFLLNQAADYFGPSAELNPFTHTWALSVEMQFYLIFPLIIYFCWDSKQHVIKERRIIWILCISGISSLIYYNWLNYHNTIAAFYLMPTRCWEFFSGSVIYFLVRERKQTAKPFSLFIPLIPSLITILLLSIFIFPKIDRFIATFLVTALTSVLIFVHRSDSFIHRLLSTKPVVALGVISYSLYLWHWSVVVISRWTIGIHWWSIPFQIAIIFLIAVFSYTFIEKPLRRSKWAALYIFKIRVGTVFYSSVAVAICAGTFLFLDHCCKECLYTGASSPIPKHGVSSLLETATYGGGYTWNALECVLIFNNEVGKQIRMENCTIGDFESESRRFLVVGNSYSIAEFEMYKVLIDEGLGAVTITSSFGASPVSNIENRGPWNEANDYYWASVVPSLIKRMQKGDVVIMVNDGHEFTPKIQTHESEQKLMELQKGLSEMSEALSKKGISIIYQSIIPFIRESNCTPDTAMPQWWHLFGDPPCAYYSREETLKRRSAYHNILLELQNKYSNFVMLDLMDVFCGGPICKYYNEKGTFLYRDEHSHPSKKASILAQPVLLESVKKVILRNQ